MRFLPAIFILIGLHSVTAADPAQELAQKLGAILEYPPSEIFVRDVTAQERSQAASPQALIAAYKIVGKNPTAFFPIHIWVGQPETFLNPETQKRIAEFDTFESGGSRKQFGTAVGGLSEGGIYFDDLEVGFRGKKAVEKNGSEFAMISVLHLASQKVDVKIALHPALGGELDIKPVAGGEKYHDNFSAAKMSAGKPVYDSPKLFRRLSEAAAATVLATPVPATTPPTQ